MKKHWFRIPLLILVLAFVLPVLLTGCSIARGQGSIVCIQYIDDIVAADYASAYELINDSIKNLTGEASTRGTQVISYSEFSEKYTAIMKAMGLKRIEYAIKNVSDATIVSTVDYTLTYYTELAGDLTFDFSISATYKERWMVDWTPALIFPTMEWGDKMLQGVLYPRRGEIFSADGELYAKNVDAIVVFCTPSKIALSDGTDAKKKAVTDVKSLFKMNDEQLTSDQASEKNWYAGFVTQVANVLELGLTEADVRNCLARTYKDNATLAKLYPWELTDELEARLLAIPGVGINNNATSTLREYPYGESLAHIIGYAGVIQKEYLYEFDDKTGEKNEEWLNDPFYDGDSWLGYSGMEAEYEKLLRGEKGSFAYIQGQDGTNKQTLYMNPSVDGQDLILTIKPAMQKRVEEVFKTVVYQDSVSGVVIVMNPTTGAVEAMASFPSYDPNNFSQGILTDTDWEAMMADPQQPLFNRATQGLYAPGSAFKPLTAIAALESGTMTLDSIFPDSEGLKPVDTIWYPAKRGGEFAESGVEKVTRTLNTNRHTPMNMFNSMVDSDNVYFSYCGMKMGWEKYYAWIEKMGMTEAIPFDMKTQVAQIKNPDSEATMTLLSMTAYGQGELLLTPLQLISYISAFQNSGNVMIPYIISSIWHSAGTDYSAVEEHTPSVWKQICTADTATSIQAMLQRVCALQRNEGGDAYGGGTGRYLRVRSYVCAGKTGTAEIGNKENEGDDAPKELAWFVAFRMANKDGSELADKDQRIVLVMLEIDMTTAPEDFTEWKFLIAQELLKDDELTEDPITDDIIG